MNIQKMTQDKSKNPTQSLRLFMQALLQYTSLDPTLSDFFKLCLSQFFFFSDSFLITLSVPTPLLEEDVLQNWHKFYLLIRQQLPKTPLCHPSSFLQTSLVYSLTLPNPGTCWRLSSHHLPRASPIIQVPKVAQLSNIPGHPRKDDSNTMEATQSVPSPTQPDFAFRKQLLPS